MASGALSQGSRGVSRCGRPASCVPRSLCSMAVADYRDRKPCDPVDPVEVLHEGAWSEAYIDARRRRDGV